MLKKGNGGLYLAQQRTKEENGRLRERDQIKFIDLGFESYREGK